MKYLLILLFLFSTHSFSGKFENICLKIGYKANTEKFNECVKKLEARKKPLNNVTNSDLAKPPSLKEQEAIMLAVELGLATLVSEMATKKSIQKSPPKGVDKKDWLSQPSNVFQGKNKKEELDLLCVLEVIC